MSKLPPLKKISFRDLTIEPFARLYNSFVSDIIYTLNRRLTFHENFASMTRVIELDGTFPVKFTWDQPLPPTGLWPINITRSDLTATTLSAGFIVEWEYKDGQVSIINTPGLVSSTSTKYQLTLITIVG